MAATRLRRPAHARRRWAQRQRLARRDGGGGGLPSRARHDEHAGLAGDRAGRGAGRTAVVGGGVDPPRRHPGRARARRPPRGAFPVARALRRAEHRLPARARSRRLRQARRRGRRDAAGRHSGSGAARRAGPRGRRGDGRNGGRAGALGRYVRAVTRGDPGRRDAVHPSVQRDAPAAPSRAGTRRRGVGGRAVLRAHQRRRARASRGHRVDRAPARPSRVRHGRDRRGRCR